MLSQIDSRLQQNKISVSRRVYSPPKTGCHRIGLVRLPGFSFPLASSPLIVKRIQSHRVFSDNFTALPVADVQHKVFPMLRMRGVERLERGVVEWNIGKSLACLKASTLLRPSKARNGSGQNNRIDVRLIPCLMGLGVLRQPLKTLQPK